MFDPRDTGWRRAVWFAAVGAVVGGPLGYLIAHLTGIGEFVWPALIAILLANAGAFLARPGGLISLVTGTAMGLLYVVGGVVVYLMFVVAAIRVGVDWFLMTDVGFWSLMLVSATLCALGVAYWVTREQQM
ncbi:MAG TPA: hypothetical protein VMW94_01145 [Actinomycetes bacterium]|nr:hypothetical protein [Actinomycetes bacterium]